VLIAIYNTEFAPPRIAEAIRIMLNILSGVPTIVIGVFIFGLLVVGHGYSAIAGSIALSVIMVPLIARSSEEVLALVPPQLREGSMALGATRSRTVVTVLLPTALGGIVTGTIVALARAAGETAPLLFTTSIFANTVTTNPEQAMGSIPLTIFFDSESPSPAAQEQAWAAALVLICIVLVCAISGRMLSVRTRRRIEKAR
jgi:phosphate transport system permease protein